MVRVVPERDDMNVKRDRNQLIALYIGCLLSTTLACSWLKNLPTPPVEQKPSAITSDIQSSASQTPEPMNTITQAVQPSNTPAPTTQALIYRDAFGIDYANPTHYLVQGKQTEITYPGVLDPLRGYAEGIDHLALIYRWLQTEFTNYSAHGATIGTVTADQLLESRQLGGCHDYGLLFAGVVRELGYPAVMIDSYSIAWIGEYQNGTAENHVGHVFIEVFQSDEWILVDPTNGWYVDEGYDPSNPIIPLKGPIAGSSAESYGFYVDLKGLDLWSYGIHNNAALTEAMDNLAAVIDLPTITYPDYDFRHFND